MQKKIIIKKKINPSTKSFQALRIFVNKEITELIDGLIHATKILQEGGILIVVNFHSIEDRMVKLFLKNNSIQCICPKEIPICQCQIKPKIEIVPRKAIVPSNFELMDNNRSRSAKMRIGRRL